MHLSRNGYGDCNMNCDWQEFEAPDNHGWRRVRCSRQACRYVTAPTPHTHGKIFAPCKVWGAGDYLAAFLGIFGITPQAVNKARRAIGIKKPCGCNKHTEGINQVGEKAKVWLKDVGKRVGWDKLTMASAARLVRGLPDEAIPDVPADDDTRPSRPN